MNKKSLILMAILFLTTLSLEVQAAPIGNPTAQLPAEKISIGPLFEFYSQDFSTNGVGLTGKGGRVFFNFNYGVDRNVEFFSHLGFSKEDIQFGGLTFSGNYGPGVELGAKATLGEIRRDHIKFGGGGKLLFSRSSVDFSSTLRSDVDWTEFGLFGGASFESQPQVIPYVGLQLTQVTTKIKDVTLNGQSSFDESNFFGLYGGVNLKLQKDLSVGLEFRIINELSAALNLSFLL